MIEKIVQAQESFQVLDCIPLGACIIQADFVVLFWNCCLEEWTKIPRDKILGTDINEYFPHLKHPQYANRLHQIFLGGPPTIFSSQLHKHLIPSPLANGKLRIQHTTVTAVPGYDKTSFYALLSIQDVTDLTYRIQDYRAMRDRAEVANRLKDEFLSTLSHELRTPLNPILGWLRLLRTQKFDAATVAHALEIIERNAEAQTQLVEDLLDISQIITGKLQVRMGKINLISVIQRAMDTVRLTANTKKIQLESVLEEAIELIVLGDPNRLQQVIWNLLFNAIKFTPKHGRVTTTLQKTNSHVEVKVSDTGIGISAEFLPHIFERFRQADGSSTRPYGGLGLGLAIARQLVELHGGTIHAESPGEGQGATFTVKLPLLESGGAEEQGSRGDALPLSGLQILVVDDDADSRELLNAILGDSGILVTAVSSAQGAMDIIEHLQPDVLLSDIGMPEEDGYMLIQKVRHLEGKKGGFIPSIALTAYSMEEERAKLIRAGFQIQLVKPVDPEQLIAVIANLTGRATFPRYH